MQVILVTNRKGGVGKTTIALNVAMNLALGVKLGDIGKKKKRKKVLLLDGDVDQADATYWALDNEDFESGVIYGTDFGFDICWIQAGEDVPDDIANGYSYVVIDGRPSAMVSLTFVKDSDYVFIPYNDKRSYQQGEYFAEAVKRINKGAQIVMVANGYKPVGEDDYTLPYDRFIRREGWRASQLEYKSKLNELCRW